MNKNESIIRGGLTLDMWGRYRLQVLDATTKEVITDYGWHKNLILNTGMDSIAATNISNASNTGVIGTGSRPNSITSSTSAITQSGNYITLTDTSYLSSFLMPLASYTSSVNKGDVIVDQDLSQSNVLSVSASMLTVDSDYTYTTPKTFTIWKTSQAQLQGEIHRSNTIYPGSSSLIGWRTGTVVTGSTTITRRTWDFPAETLTRSYNEVGTSLAITTNTPLFSRAVLPVTLSVSPNQQVRMTYDLVTSFGPTTPVYRTASIGGWPVAPSTTTNCTESIQSFLASVIDISGSVHPYQSIAASLEPSVGSFDAGNFGSNGWGVFFSRDSASLSAFGTASNRNDTVNIANNGALDFYASGSFTRTKTCSFPIYQYDSGIRSIGFGAYFPGNGANPQATTHQAMCMLFDQPQSKTSTQTLTLTWRWYWNRILQ